MVNGDLGYITEEPMTSTTSSKRMFPAESGTVDNFILRPTASQSIYVTTNVHYITMIMICDHIVCRHMDFVHVARVIMLYAFAANFKYLADGEGLVA